MAEAVEKIKLLRSSPDLSTATYQIFDESHTIGNSLRWMLMKKYAISVPLTLLGMLMDKMKAPRSNSVVTENAINVRIQMYDGKSSLDALINALGELDKVCETIEDKYLDSLREGKFERWEEKV